MMLSDSHSRVEEEDDDDEKRIEKSFAVLKNFYFSWSLALGVLFRCCLLSGLFFKFDVCRENVLKNTTAVFSGTFFPFRSRSFTFSPHRLCRTLENSRLNRVYVFICVPRPDHPLCHRLHPILLAEKNCRRWTKWFLNLRKIDCTTVPCSIVRRQKATKKSKKKERIKSWRNEKKEMGKNFRKKSNLNAIFSL